MKEIEIHQCLYGYENGHRLLASSTSLPPDVATTLLLLSDLAPGLTLPSSEGYWTGMPLPGAKVYALMYTWMAYEMPRPGCVWSHVLLIPFPEMARLRDLSILCQYISRPKFNYGFDMYNSSIMLNYNTIENTNYKSVISNESIKVIINAAYNLSGKVKIESSLDNLGDSIFCIWSQQWPRLRRSFSFRTASNPHGITSDKNRFDISIVRNLTKFFTSEKTSLFESVDAWEKYAINDAMSSEGTTFRKYLWRYGTDILSGRKSFKNISELYLYTFKNKLNDEDLFNFLKIIMHHFPSINEAKTLKLDIVLSGRHSFFPPVNKLDLVFFYILNNTQESLPSLTDDIFHSIDSDWNDRKSEMLTIGEKSVGNENPLCSSFLNVILRQVLSDAFFSLTNYTPKLREYLLSNKPSLMDNSEFVDLAINKKLEYVELIPLDDLALAKSILLKILNIDNYELVSKMYSRFKELTIETVVLSFEASCLNKYNIIDNEWIKVIDANPNLVIDNDYISKSKSTMALYKYYAVLKASDLLFSVDMKSWILCLNSAVDNIDGRERVELVLYLFELALKNPIRDCEVIFESFFEEIHSYLEHSFLSLTQSEAFLEKLPYLGWFSNWDNCQRLRVAIVNTYVSNNLTATSFMRLTRSKYIYSELINTLLETKGGKDFLDKLIK
ncbi:hypothetical protein [Serratia plymuthica]|uniref:GAP1-N1 domain-containing protein n=1 Tax=Serratia plymuthica TaxID=82996 RepID=UPI000A52F149|nr:hypothetical protein [Serratia plymuthica]